MNDWKQLFYLWSGLCQLIEEHIGQLFSRCGQLKSYGLPSRSARSNR